jgi:hypothetical protein
MKHEIDDQELLRYLDDEAGPQVEEHIGACPHCRQRANALAREQRRLSLKLYRAACPEPHLLGEYQLGLLAESIAAPIRAHIDTCPHCVAELTQLAHYLDDLAPDLELSRLDQARNRVRVLIARLTSAPQDCGWQGGPALAPAFAGVRGAPTWPRRYEVDEVEIVLEVSEDDLAPGRKAVFGLVTGLEEPQGPTVHVWREGIPQASSQVDELGNFVLTDLAPGSYELILTNPQIEVHVQELDVS